MKRFILLSLLGGLLATNAGCGLLQAVFCCRPCAPRGDCTAAYGGGLHWIGVNLRHWKNADRWLALPASRSADVVNAAIFSMCRNIGLFAVKLFGAQLLSRNAAGRRCGRTLS